MAICNRASKRTSRRCRAHPHWQLTLEILATGLDGLRSVVEPWFFGPTFGGTADLAKHVTPDAAPGLHWPVVQLLVGFFRRRPSGGLADSTARGRRTSPDLGRRFRVGPPRARLLATPGLRGVTIHTPPSPAVPRPTRRPGRSPIPLGPVCCPGFPPATASSVL